MMSRPLGVGIYFAGQMQNINMLGSSSEIIKTELRLLIFIELLIMGEGSIISGIFVSTTFSQFPLDSGMQKSILCE